LRSTFLFQINNQHSKNHINDLRLKIVKIKSYSFVQIRNLERFANILRNPFFDKTAAYEVYAIYATVLTLKRNRIHDFKINNEFKQATKVKEAARSSVSRGAGLVIERLRNLG